MEKTPKWLLDGAFTVYKTKRRYAYMFYTASPSLALVIAITFLLLIHLKAYAAWLDRQSDVMQLLISIMLVAVFYGMPSILGILARQILRRKYARSKEFQKLYLQSKIDEANDYELKVPLLVKEIREEARNKIGEIRSNLNTLMEKKDEAETLLATM
jgi:hypothetical protein